MEINVFITGDELELSAKKTTFTGSLNAYICRFQFTKGWELEEGESLGITAIFFQKGEYYTQVITDNECYVPAEVIQEKGNFRIGVVGVFYKTEGEEETVVRRISTDWSRPVTVGDGAYQTDATEAQTPTPTVWDQYIAKVDAAVNAAQDAQGEAQTACDDAISAKTAAEDAKQSVVGMSAVIAQTKNAVDDMLKESTAARDDAKKYADAARESKDDAVAAASAAGVHTKNAYDFKESAKTSAELAGEYKDAAEAAKTDLETARDAAEGYANTAKAEADEATGAKNTIRGYKTAAETAQDKAEAAQGVAEQSAKDATSAMKEALNAQQSASSSAIVATTSAQAAKDAKTAAEQAALDAQNSLDTAEGALGDLDERVTNLEENGGTAVDADAMVYKGTVVGDAPYGTVTMPDDAKNGDTYKVVVNIPEGTLYESQVVLINDAFSARNGDTLIAVVAEDGSITWTLIPSGDEGNVYLEIGAGGQSSGIPQYTYVSNNKLTPLGNTADEKGKFLYIDENGEAKLKELYFDIMTDEYNNAWVESYADLRAAVVAGKAIRFQHGDSFSPCIRCYFDTVNALECIWCVEWIDGKGKAHGFCENGSYVEMVMNDSYATKATTLAGYGIEDAYTKTEVQTMIQSAILDSWEVAV